MSTNKPTQPLVFPSIKVGYAPPESAARRRSVPPAPPPEQPLVFEAVDEPITAVAPVAPEPAAAAPQGKALSPAPEPPPPAASPFSAIAPLSAIRSQPRPAPDRMPYMIAGGAALLWLAGVVALAVALGGASNGGPLSLIVVAALALAPLGLFWAAAYAVGQAQKLAAESRRAQALTDQMIGPAALAAAEAGTIVEAMRAQIASASQAAGEAHGRLSSLRQALAEETGKMVAATQSADKAARNLAESLLSERTEMTTLAVTLDARAAAVTDAINRQARMVAEASDLAEVQLREAEASLAARAADLAAAAGEATDAGRTASEDLARQVARLETAGIGVGDQLRALEEGLTTQRASLVTVAHALRADQEDFAALSESQTAQLSGFLAGASKDVAALSEVTTLGAQSLSDLIASAAEKFTQLAEAAKVERDLFGQSAMGSLNALSEAGAREREGLESQMLKTIDALHAAAGEAREAANVHSEAARTRVDQLNEAAFAAGEKADKVFDARLAEARALIETSATLVEEAGANTAAKLAEGVTEARTALESLQKLVAEVGARTAALPAETEAQAQEVRAAIQKSMDEMLAGARRAAEETQAIDTAFQERVKRNYEMLSEAVQLMGVVAQGGQGAGALRRPPAGRARAAEPAPEAPAQTTAPIADAEAGNGSARLKFTPMASEEEFQTALEAASGAAAPAPPAAEPESGWTWKELLTSIDGEAAGPDVELGEALCREIEDMGIDPAALLSRNRIDELAAAIQTKDLAGAREVVRTLAPAAIRRLSRRLIGDNEFRAKGQAFIRRYAAVIDEAARRDKQGFQAASLLNSNVGRAYLLLDAAAGEPG